MVERGADCSERKRMAMVEEGDQQWWREDIVCGRRRHYVIGRGGKL